MTTSSSSDAAVLPVTLSQVRHARRSCLYSLVYCWIAGLLDWIDWLIG